MPEPPPDVRASDAERERAGALLRDAAGEGRLTFEELADRLDLALRATTRGELERLTADLPVPAPAVTVGPVPSREVAAPPASASSVFGDLRRSGTWTVPARSGWKTVFGDVVLDLREARVGHAQVTIEARSVFGDVQLLVPDSVAVEVHARALLGDVKQEAGESAQPGAPRVLLRASTVFGDVRVRARRLRERLAERLLGPRAGE